VYLPRRKFRPPTSSSPGKRSGRLKQQKYKHRMETKEGATELSCFSSVVTAMAQANGKSV
jgi:hypothetical protein